MDQFPAKDLDLLTALSKPDRDKLERAAADISQVLEKAHRSKEDGYYLKSKVYGSKVYVYVMNGPALVSSGFAMIRDGEITDKAMAQAFSYAAHMAFKHCQWKDEFLSEAPED